MSLWVILSDCDKNYKTVELIKVTKYLYKDFQIKVDKVVRYEVYCARRKSKTDQFDVPLKIQNLTHIEDCLLNDSPRCGINSAKRRIPAKQSPNDHEFCSVDDSLA